MSETLNEAVIRNAEAIAENHDATAAEKMAAKIEEAAAPGGFVDQLMSGPPEPEPDILEEAQKAIDLGDGEKADELLRKHREQLDQHPTAQARKAEREGRQAAERQDADVGRAIRARIAQEERAAAIDDAIDQLSTSDDELFTYDPETGEEQPTDALLQRALAIWRAKPTPEQIEALRYEAGDDIVTLLEHHDAKTALEATQAEARAQFEQDYAPEIAAHAEVERLASLEGNHHLRDHWPEVYEILGQIAEGGTITDGVASARTAARIVDARLEHEKAWARDVEQNVRLFSKGDRRHYEQVFLPELAEKDPVAYERLTTAPAFDPNDILPPDAALPWKTPLENLERTGWDEIARKMEDHLLDRTPRGDDPATEIGRAIERSKAYNLAKYGNPNGPQGRN